MDSTENLDLPYIMPSQAQKHVTHNEALCMLDALVQLCVLDRDRATPPSSPAQGDRHIVAEAASGGWAGQEHRIAVWRDGAWSFIEPRPGFLAWVAAEEAFLCWTGAAWLEIGTMLTALGNLSRLGVGTEADATNPFAAKLNKVLWTALTTSEGGDGSLRYTMNKQAAGQVLSLLLQSNWSGRAELGLIGDDDLVFKVSPDGGEWIEALRIGNDDGAALFSRPMAIRAGDGDLALDIDKEGPSGGVFQATRYADGIAGPVFFGRKARGSRLTPMATQEGDSLLGFRGYGHTGADFAGGASGVAFLLEASEAWEDGSTGTRIRFFTTRNGNSALDERLRIADTGDLQMDGANTVITASRHPVLRSYTVATLPVASPAGQLVHVIDGSEGRHLACSDGSAWRFPDGVVVS